jgi:hypothetical protein
MDANSFGEPGTPHFVSGGPESVVQLDNLCRLPQEKRT